MQKLAETGRANGVAWDRQVRGILILQAGLHQIVPKSQRPQQVSNYHGQQNRYTLNFGAINLGLQLQFGHVQKELMF